MAPQRVPIINPSSGVRPIDTRPVAHRAETGAVTEMRHHRAFAGQFRRHFGQAPGDEVKGKAVKAVAPDSVLVETSWNGKAAGGRGKAVVEGGVEAGNLR
jgi:hypothetical protein